MSNEKYTNYSKMPAKEDVKRTPVDVNEIVIEPITAKVETTPAVVNVAPVDPEPEVTPPPPVDGEVVGCARLRVRKSPDKKSEVLGFIEEGSKVMIDVGRSTTNWYAVYTAAGLEGFCMKEYISTK